MYAAGISVLGEQNPLHVEYLSIIVGFCVLSTDVTTVDAPRHCVVCVVSASHSHIRAQSSHRKQRTTMPHRDNSSMAEDEGDQQNELQRLREEVRRLTAELRRKNFNIRQICIVAAGASMPHSILMMKGRDSELTRQDRQVKVAIGVLHHWLHKRVWPHYKFLPNQWFEWSDHPNDMSCRALREIGSALPSGYEPEAFWVCYCIPHVKKIFKENRANTAATMKRRFFSECVNTFCFTMC